MSEFTPNTDREAAIANEAHKLGYLLCQKELSATQQKLEAAEIKNAELTRKLAEQQAALFTVRAILAGCEESDAVKAVEHIQKHFKDKHEELSAIIAEAKSKAVPEFQTFNEWMHNEIPSGTIIGDAGWWASRIYRKFIAPSAPQPETDRGSNE